MLCLWWNSVKITWQYCFFIWLTNLVCWLEWIERFSFISNIFIFFFIHCILNLSKATVLLRSKMIIWREIYYVINNFVHLFQMSWRREGGKALKNHTLQPQNSWAICWKNAINFVIFPTCAKPTIERNGRTLNKFRKRGLVSKKNGNIKTVLLLLSGGLVFNKVFIILQAIFHWFYDLKLIRS